MITDWNRGNNETNYQIEVANEIAYFNTLDARFRVEVQRVKPYEGILKVFDHTLEDKEIYSREVGISYDARFGPDFADVNDWNEEVIDFIDNTYMRA